MRSVPSARRTAVIAAGTVVAAALAVTPVQAAESHSVAAAAASSDPYSAFAFALTSTEPTIYSFINSATTTLDMTMYELNDTTAVNDLIARENAGVTVRVILDQAEKSTNQTAYNSLTAAGIGVVWSSTAFTYTHQKTITVNGNESLILSGNLTSEYYTTSRDYGVFDSDANDVNAIEATFNADYAHTSITPSDGDNLLWSPTTAQSQVLSVINGATKTLDVTEEEFSDTAVVNAIVADAKRGVTVRLDLENESSDYASEISEVEAAGATVKTYTSSTGFYIHAKSLVADYGLSTVKVEIGSMNMTSNSLTANRELGIILTDPAVAKVVETTFVDDFNGTNADTVTVTSPGNQTGTVGTAASLKISGSDSASGQTLTYTANNLPPGLSISSAGQITGTPTTNGSYTTVVTATDTTGETADAAFNWNVGGTSTGGGDTVTVTNPGSQTGTVGTAASLKVSATDSASGQSLTYTASGLPTGLSISSAGQISGTPSTAGTYSATVTATDSTGAAGSASFTWTIGTSGGSGSGCTATQLLGNPGFENGSSNTAPWTTTTTHSSGSVVSDSSSEPAHSGTWDAWLDGWGTTTTDTVAQTVTIPSTCSTASFSFWLHIDTAETTKSTAYDTLKVQVVNSSGTVLGTLATFSNLNAATGYTQHTYSLASYIGQSVTLKFTGAEDSEDQTSFVLDDTALNVD